MAAVEHDMKPLRQEIQKILKVDLSAKHSTSNARATLRDLEHLADGRLLVAQVEAIPNFDIRKLSEQFINANVGTKDKQYFQEFANS